MTKPALRILDPNDPVAERFFSRVPEYGDRAQRVAVTTRVVPWRVLSVLFY